MKQTEITGNRIVLRRMTGEDTPLIVRWRNTERVRRNFIYREPFTQQSHAEWIKNMVDTGRVVQFIICEKKKMRPIGSVYFRDIDLEKREAEYGIFIGEEDAAGKGYGNETAELAVSFAMNEMGLEHLILRVFTDNLAAVKSYEKAGFSIKEIVKAVECSDGEKKDMFLMSLCKERTVEKGRELISFVIPCYRSEFTLTKVVEEIEDTVTRLNREGADYRYEIILVNDCSPDHTFDVITALCRSDKRIKGIDLAKNAGQHAALMAGFHYVQGDIVVCLDDDGQTPADEVGKLLDGIHEGTDVVYARYEHKMHSVFRNMGSFLNEEMAKLMLGKPRDLYVSSYFAARRFVVEEMKRYTNAYPYVIGLVLRSTGNIKNVTVHHREREIGTSGYTFGKLLGLWLNGFTAFSVKPLRIATALGCICSVAGFIYGIYTVIKKLVNPLVPMGFSSMMSAIVFLGGMTMLMLGLVGEYVGRMYISMNNSPQFVVKEILNEEEKAAGPAE